MSQKAVILLTTVETVMPQKSVILLTTVESVMSQKAVILLTTVNSVMSQKAVTLLQVVLWVFSSHQLQMKLLQFLIEDSDQASKQEQYSFSAFYCFQTSVNSEFFPVCC